MRPYWTRRTSWWLSLAWWLSPAALVAVISLVGLPREPSASAADERKSAQPNGDLKVPGKLLVGEGMFLPHFELGPGGTLEWPNKLRISLGGGEGSGLPAKDGFIRAQPGGNIVLQPQGDYMRCAVDLLPPKGKQADLDAIAELTLHRVQPTAKTQEMISYSALARKQDQYGVVVEAHGEGKLKPLVFMVVRGGLNKGEEAFSAEAMRMTEDGTMVFGLHREGGRLARPVDSITLDQPHPTKRGNYNSDYLKWVAKRNDGTVVHLANWRAQVRVDTPEGGSRFVVQSGVEDGAYSNRFEVTDQGEMELPGKGGAIGLRSANGKRWRVAVDDSGKLQVTPAK